MKRILRLDWDRCPAGYAVEKRQGHGRDLYAGLLLEEVDAQANGEFVAALSATRFRFSVEGIGKRDLACLALANAARTPEGVVSFATSWGLPYGHDDVPLGDVYELMDQLNIAIGYLQEKGSDAFLRGLSHNARAGVRERNLDGKVYCQASCLAVFCRHQLLELAEAKREIRRCVYCLELYAGARGAGKRHGAQRPRFCGDRCRNKNHSKGLD
jgi:hypothetical protein